MTDIYKGYAGVYDLWMDPEMYDGWEKIILEVLKDCGIDPEKGRYLLTDAGCGTGQMSLRFAADGFDVTGVDISPDMIREAVSNSERLGIPAGFYCQDMRKLHLKEPADVIVCLCDSLNYMLTDGDLEKMFSAVSCSLSKNGLFITDIHTPYYYRNVLGEDVFADDREEAAFIWENSFDGDTMLNSCDLTLFINEGGMYTKHKEHHVQKAYTAEQICQVADRTGMNLYLQLDPDTGRSPDEGSERIMLFFKGKGGIS